MRIMKFGLSIVSEKASFRRKLKTLFYVFGLPLFVAIVIRVFFVEVFIIPSPSMSPTLIPGDIIIVNKLRYGARLWVNDKTGIETRGLGYSSIKHNDIVVFNFPEADTIYRNRPDLNFYDYIGWQGREKALHDTIEHGSLVYLPVKYRQPYVKRCIGLPGDTLMIFKNSVIVNDCCVKDPIGSWKHLQDSLKSNPLAFIKREMIPVTKDIHSYNYFFPHYIDKQWDNNCYGPLYVPRKGKSVKLTYQNISKYKRIITAYEHNKLDTLRGEVYVNGIKTRTYFFKQNYYFMMGDNHFGSIDSRFWGFVPENHIIGKASLILCSWDDENESWFKFRTERILSIIH
ncbi:MAG TPA: signal peptidase I [Bacteroidales bacterium]